MTLRLVNDKDQPDDVPYCTQIPCRTRSRRRSATILVSEIGHPYMPACDECARFVHEMHPCQVTLAPLAEYVDWYAEAREAALAAPEQVIQPVQITGPVAVDDEVLRHIWLDQAIYCRVHWCETQGRLTSADQRLNAIGGLWYPACADCIARYDPAQVEVAPMSEANTAWELEMAGEYFASKHWSAPGPLVSRRAKILWWAIPAGVLTLGITMTAIASNAISRYNWAMQSWEHNLPSYPSYATVLKGFGIFFIVVSALALAGVLTAYLISEATSVPAGQFRVPRQPWAASQLTAPVAQGYQLGIPVGQLATTAALVGAEVIWRQKIRASQARARDSALGIAPLNNVHAGMMRTTAMLQQRAADQRQQQAQQQRDATQRAIMGELRQLSAPPRLIPGRRSR